MNGFPDIADTHHVWGFPAAILLILALSGLIIPALQRIRISPVLGYLLCGLFIGPYALGRLVGDYPALSPFTITDFDLIRTLAELGVVFLLFMIGLELSFSRLVELKKFVLGLGTAQILFTAYVIYLIASQYDNTQAAAILIGGAFALSSTAIVMQLMIEQHLFSRPIGKICFSVLLMQDLAVVPMLVLVSVFSGPADEPIPLVLSQALVTAVVVVAAMFAIGKLFLRPLLRVLSPARNAEWLLAVTLFLIIGAATLTHAFGLSAALGAFLAGLLIAETEYKHEIEVITEPVKDLFMGVFFLSVGMATDIFALAQYPVLLPLSVIGVFLIKAFLFYPLARFFRIPKRQAAQSAIMLAPCGEFAFIIIGLAFIGQMIPPEHAQFFLMVTAVSMLLTPLTSKLAPLAGRLVADKEAVEDTHVPASIYSGDHIIVAGFGRVGQTVGDVLESKMIPYVGLDKDGPHVAALRADGYPVIYGNGRHIELWRKLKAENASAAVITLDEHAATGAILRSLHREFPTLPIIVRARDTRAVQQYYDHGAASVVPETLESTLQLVFTILDGYGIEREEIYQIINEHRQMAMIGETPATQKTQAS